MAVEVKVCVKYVGLFCLKIPEFFTLQEIVAALTFMLLGLLPVCAHASEGVVLIAPEGSSKAIRELAINVCLIAARDADTPFKPAKVKQVQKVKEQLLLKEQAKEIRVVGFIRNGKPLVDENLAPRSDSQPDDHLESAASMDYVACLMAFGYQWPGQNILTAQLPHPGTGAAAIGGSDSRWRPRDVLSGEQWYGATASHDGQTIIISGCNSRLVKSLDGGASWAVSTATDIRGCISAISFSDNGKTLVIGGSFNGLYFSTDGGETWHQSTIKQGGKALSPTNIRRIDFDIDGRRGWVLTSLNEGRVYRTNDGGRSWEVFHEGTRSESLSSIWINNSGSKAWIGGATGTGYWGPSFVTQTTDDGKTWRRIMLEGKGFIIGLAFDQSGLVGQAIGSDGLLYNTKDGGETWESQKAEMLDKGNGWTGALYAGDGVVQCVVGDGALLRLEGTWNKTLKEVGAIRLEGVGASPDSKTVVGVGYGKVFLSKDGCRSWERIRVFAEQQ